MNSSPKTRASFYFLKKERKKNKTFASLEGNHNLLLWSITLRQPQHRVSCKEWCGRESERVFFPPSRPFPVYILLGPKTLYRLSFFSTRWEINGLAVAVVLQQSILYTQGCVCVWSCWVLVGLGKNCQQWKTPKVHTHTHILSRHHSSHL